MKIEAEGTVLQKTRLQGTCVVAPPAFQTPHFWPSPLLLAHKTPTKTTSGWPGTGPTGVWARQEGLLGVG